MICAMCTQDTLHTVCLLIANSSAGLDLWHLLRAIKNQCSAWVCVLHKTTSKNCVFFRSHSHCFTFIAIPGVKFFQCYVMLVLNQKYHFRLLYKFILFYLWEYQFSCNKLSSLTFFVHFSFVDTQSKLLTCIRNIRPLKRQISLHHDTIKIFIGIWIFFFVIPNMRVCQSFTILWAINDIYLHGLNQQMFIQ